mmetsp:Transcript_11607/g.43298  ORF Transcript_11607/g.43298 Transcript_11607/m.43298 type:complete len:209 (-) Transcript_11607:504-1130(-)
MGGLRRCDGGGAHEGAQGGAAGQGGAAAHAHGPGAGRGGEIGLRRQGGAALRGPAAGGHAGPDPCDGEVRARQSRQHQVQHVRDVLDQGGAAESDDVAEPHHSRAELPTAPVAEGAERTAGAREQAGKGAASCRDRRRPGHGARGDHQATGSGHAARVELGRGHDGAEGDGGLRRERSGQVGDCQREAAGRRRGRAAAGGCRGARGVY